MLDRRADDVTSPLPPAVLRQTQEREVVGLRRAASEDHLVRLRPDQHRYLISRLLAGLLRAGAELVGAAAGIPELRLHVLDDKVPNPRLHRRCRVAV